MVMLGLFSYVVDSMQMQSAEASSKQAAEVGCIHSPCCQGRCDTCALLPM